MYIGDLLGRAEGLGKCGFFLDPHTEILWVKNGVGVRVDGNKDQITDRLEYRTPDRPKVRKQLPALGADLKVVPGGNRTRKIPGLEWLVGTRWVWAGTIDQPPGTVEIRRDRGSRTAGVRKRLNVRPDGPD
jgi:hypothetical protein